MTWYEFLITAGAVVSAVTLLAKKVGKPIVELLHEIKTLVDHDREQYIAILRLTIMSPDMPISERITAGREYIKLDGNGDVKKYYEHLLKTHTIQGGNDA